MANPGSLAKGRVRTWIKYPLKPGFNTGVIICEGKPYPSDKCQGQVQSQ